MDPVTQVLAQQQSGSAGGQGFGQFFVAGRQDARQREQLNLARRQEDRLSERQRTLLPYEQAIMGLQITTAGQTADFNRMKLATVVQQNNALPEILALENHFMTAPEGYKDPQGIATYEQLYRKYPQAFAEGAPGHDIRLRIKMPHVLDAEMRQLRDISQQLVAGGMVPEEATVKRGPVSATFVNPQVVSQYAPANVQKELSALNDAYQRKDKDAIAAIRSKLKLDELSPVSKQQFEAEIDALDRDFKLATRPQEYLQKRLEIITRYFNMAQQESSAGRVGATPTPPSSATTTNPPARGQRFRPDFKTGKLVPVP